MPSRSHQSLPSDDQPAYEGDRPGEPTPSERRRAPASTRRKGDDQRFAWIAPSKTVQILVSGGAAMFVCVLFGAVFYQMLRDQSGNNAAQAQMVKELMAENRENMKDIVKQLREDRQQEREENAKRLERAFKHGDDAVGAIRDLKMSVDKLDGTLKGKKIQAEIFDDMQSLAPIPKVP